MPSGLSKTYLLLPAIGAIAVPNLKRLPGRWFKRTPQHACYRNYDWLHRVNQALEEAIEADRDYAVRMFRAAARSGDPIMVLAAIDDEMKTGISVADDKTIKDALPKRFVRDLCDDVADHIADGQLVRFAWEDAPHWGHYWAPVGGQGVAVVVVLGPSPF
jgi:hypothetical protein